MYQLLYTYVSVVVCICLGCYIHVYWLLCACILVVIYIHIGCYIHVYWLLYAYILVVIYIHIGYYIHMYLLLCSYANSPCVLYAYISVVIYICIGCYIQIVVMCAVRKQHVCIKPSSRCCACYRLCPAGCHGRHHSHSEGTAPARFNASKDLPGFNRGVYLAGIVLCGCGLSR